MTLGGFDPLKLVEPRRRLRKQWLFRLAQGDFPMRALRFSEGFGDNPWKRRPGQPGGHFEIGWSLVHLPPALIRLRGHRPFLHPLPAVFMNLPQLLNDEVIRTPVRPDSIL